MLIAPRKPMFSSMKRRNFNLRIIQGSTLFAMSTLAQCDELEGDTNEDLSLIEVFQDGRLLYDLAKRNNFKITQMGGNGDSSDKKGSIMIRRYSIDGDHDSLEKNLASEYQKILKVMFKTEVPNPTPSGGHFSPKVQTVILRPSAGDRHIGIEIAKFVFEEQPRSAILIAIYWDFS